MRLDKFLKEVGLGSRNEVKKLIKEQRIKVNDVVVKKDGLIIDELNDLVSLDDTLLHYQKYYYFLLNKPKGFLSATSDPNQPTLLDFFSGYSHLDLFPVGRLDKDTTGVILITNDGEFAHRLISPKYQVDKVYIATLDKDLDMKIKDEFENGIILDQELTLPSKLEKLDSKVCKVTLHQGKYHQVKRMFEYFFYKVVELHRASFGGITLGDLQEGKFRELTEEEVTNLKKLTKIL